MNNAAQITYFDLVRMESLSFYLLGLLANQRKSDFRLQVRRTVPPILNSNELSRDRKMQLQALGIFEYREAGEQFYFCIDRSDHADTALGEGYDYETLERVRYYFKVNYNHEVVETDPILRTFREKIKPITSGFPLRLPFSQYVWQRPFSGKKNTAKWTNYKFSERLRRWLNLPTLAQMQRLRQVKTPIDVFFVMSYYPQTHHSQNAELRHTLMEKLKNLAGFNIVTGFATDKPLPAEYERYRLKRFGPLEYLQQLAQSKVVIYVRGAHDCISAKLGHYLALGKPICGQRILNNTENLYSNARFEEQFAFEDADVIVERAVELLAKPALRDKLARANAQTFDNRFAPDQVAARMLYTISGRQSAPVGIYDAKAAGYV